jgi:hypothetical protein
MRGEKEENFFPSPVANLHLHYNELFSTFGCSCIRLCCFLSTNFSIFNNFLRLCWLPKEFPLEYFDYLTTKTQENFSKLFLLILSLKVTYFPMFTTMFMLFVLSGTLSLFIKLAANCYKKFNFLRLFSRRNKLCCLLRLDKK